MGKQIIPNATDKQRKITFTKEQVEAIAKSPVAVLMALSPRLQDAAMTVLFKQNNAPICKDILLRKLQGWEASLHEYTAKAPSVLADTIADLTRKTKAARFALGLPEKDAMPPAIAYVSVNHLRTMLQLAAIPMYHDWSPATLSSNRPMDGGACGSWIKNGLTSPAV